MLFEYQKNLFLYQKKKVFCIKKKKCIKKFVSKNFCIKKKKLFEYQKNLCWFVVATFGFLAMVYAFSIQYINATVIQIGFICRGALTGPGLAVFTLGIFFPWCNTKVGNLHQQINCIFARYKHVVVQKRLRGLAKSPRSQQVSHP